MLQCSFYQREDLSVAHMVANVDKPFFNLDLACEYTSRWSKSPILLIRIESDQRFASADFARYSTSTSNISRMDLAGRLQINT
jgi:hypothetical protein